jgi:DNA replication protein DnaC
MLTRNYRSATWEQIFKDAMTTAAAIDRLVHHSMILELNVPGYRLNTTKKKDSKQTSKYAPSSK